jgi:hypothetical protein
MNKYLLSVSLFVVVVASLDLKRDVNNEVVSLASVAQIKANYMIIAQNLKTLNTILKNRPVKRSHRKKLEETEPLIDPEEPVAKDMEPIMEGMKQVQDASNGVDAVKSMLNAMSSLPMKQMMNAIGSDMDDDQMDQMKKSMQLLNNDKFTSSLGKTAEMIFNMGSDPEVTEKLSKIGEVTDEAMKTFVSGNPQESVAQLGKAMFSAGSTVSGLMTTFFPKMMEMKENIQNIQEAVDDTMGDFLKDVDEHDYDETDFP